MEQQTRGLREAMGPNAEFVYVNAPFEARGPTDVSVERIFAESKPFYEWWQAKYLEREEVEDAAAAQELPAEKKIWTLEFEDLDQCLEYMDEQLRVLGPFDVVVGFSQGTVLLTILSMWYLLKQKVRLWKLCVCFCGVRVRAVNCRPWFETSEGDPIPVPFPSIHVAGRKDPLYQDSLLLADMYDDHPAGSPFQKVVLEHDSGHKFPTPAKHKQLYADLAHMIHQHLAVADTQLVLSRL